MDVTLVRDTESFRALRDDWEALLSRCVPRHVFMTWEWLFTWWVTFGQGRELFVVKVTDNGALVGMAPFMLFTRAYGRGYRSYRIRYLQFIGFRSSQRWNDWMDIIAVRREEVWRTLFHYLREQQHLWDVVELWDLPEESDTMAIMRGLNGQAGLSVEQQRISTCPYTSTTSDWASYYETHVSKDVRADLDRQIRRLRGKGEMRVVRAEGAALTTGLETLFDLSQHRQVARHQTSIFSDEVYRNFYRALAQVFPSTYLDCSLLSLDGTVLAGHFGFRYDGKFYYVTPTFDPAFASFSPGKVLLRYLLEGCFSDAAIVEFDFLRGSEAYKHQWATGTRHGCKVVVSNPRLSGWIARVLSRIPPYVRRPLIGIHGASKIR